MPGQLNTDSTMTRPLISDPMTSPTTVSVGSVAFGSTCR